LVRQILSLASALLLPFPPLAAFAQEKTTPSHPRATPQIAGRFIDSDGTHLKLHYVRNAQPETFIGTIQSTCIAEFPSGERKPLDLSTIPLGTAMTVYYVRHAVGTKSENVIMAVRFDRLQPGSTLPQGVYIPCFKGTEAPALK